MSFIDSSSSARFPLGQAVPDGDTDSSLDLLIVTGLDGIYRFVGAASAAVVGWDPTDLVGHHRGEFTHPDDRATLDRAQKEASRLPGDAVTTTSRFRCVDGSYRRIEASSSLIDADGEQLLVSAVRGARSRDRSDPLVPVPPLTARESKHPSDASGPHRAPVRILVASLLALVLGAGATMVIAKGIGRAVRRRTLNQGRKWDRPSPWNLPRMQNPRT